LQQHSLHAKNAADCTLDANVESNRALVRLQVVRVAQTQNTAKRPDICYLPLDLFARNSHTVISEKVFPMTARIVPAPAKPTRLAGAARVASVGVLLATLGLVSGARADGPAPSASATVPAAPAPAAAGTAQPQPQALADATVVKVQAFYDATTSFKANFKQQYTATLHNKVVNSKGSVTFAKPGKMSWRYEDPAGNRVVSDGANLSVYQAAEKQLFQQVVNNSQYPAALSFLTGQGSLAGNFTFSLFQGQTMNFPGGLVLVGIPKTPTAAYTKVLFYVDAQSYQVRRVMIIDSQSNRNRFDFEEPRVNEVVPAAEFVFQAPPGTTTVRP
jgi:outer membrane lipoprotein carrier protein